MSAKLSEGRPWVSRIKQYETEMFFSGLVYIVFSAVLIKVLTL